MRVYPRPSPRAPGSPALWRWYAMRCTEFNAREAAVGRYLGLSGKATPQRGATGPAAVAWHRASGAQPGYMNRRARRHRLQCQLPSAGTLTQLND